MAKFRQGKKVVPILVDGVGMPIAGMRRATKR
jgi:hypothetical protein